MGGSIKYMGQVGLDERLKYGEDYKGSNSHMITLASCSGNQRLES
jgi:hypothetical protein